MNFPRTLAVARKETRQIVRDSRSLYLALGIPVLLMVLFGYALSLDVNDIPIAVWDQDRSPESREFLDRLTSSGYFRVVFATDRYNRIVNAIDDNAITVGITIPYNFSEHMKKGQPITVQALMDGSDSTRAGIALEYLKVIIAVYEGDYQFRELDRQAVKSRIKVPVEPRIRILYNPELVSRNNIVPGLIAIIMMVIAALLTSLTIVRERETGTMEQLISTPVKPSELIVGKLTPYFVLGYVDLIIVYLMGEYVFHVPFKGSLLLMFGCSCVFLIGALALGFLISVTARNQFFATQFALLSTFLPTFLLSGFVFPISNMPDWLQVITYIVPARHLITILRAIYLKGAGIEIIAFPLFMLVVISGFIVLIAVKKLRKTIA